MCLKWPVFVFWDIGREGGQARVFRAVIKSKGEAVKKNESRQDCEKWP